jgi:hypothetical protein
MTLQRQARQAKRGLWADPEVAPYHRFRPAGVYGNTRLKVYFHPDDGARNILLADPFVNFESPEQAAAAGYRPSMDYTAFARRERLVLSGDPLPMTTGAPVAGTGPEPVGAPSYSASTPSSPPAILYSPSSSSRVYIGRPGAAPLPPYGYNSSYTPYGSSPRP